VNVTLYSQPNCQPCRATKRQLENLEIPYEEIDVSEDGDALAFVLSLGHQQSPVVYVDDVTHWSGFRHDLIRNLAKEMSAE